MADIGTCKKRAPFSVVERSIVVGYWDRARVCVFVRIHVYALSFLREISKLLLLNHNFLNMKVLKR
jgi:hypothetical protein